MPGVTASGEDKGVVLDTKQSLERDILEALLYCSCDRNEYILPSIREYILSDVVGATVEYIRGGGFHPQFHDFIKAPGGTFEGEVYKYFKNGLAKAEEEISPKVIVTIENLVKPRQVCPYPDKPYDTTNLYDHLKGGIVPQGLISSTFSLPFGIIMHVEKEILPHLTSIERDDLNGIGTIMRRFINQDLRYIKKNYSS